MTAVPRTLRRILVAGLGTGALAVAATTAISSASAATPTAASPTAASPTATPPAPPSGTAKPPAGNRPPSPHGGPGKGGPGKGGPRGGPGGGPRDDGVVTAVSGTALTVKDAAGTSHTYVLNAKTTYHAGPKTTLTRTAVKVGDRVHVRTGGSSSTTALDVDEHLPHIDGTVTAIASGSITVTDNDGFRRTIVTTGSTTWTKGGATVAASTVKVGTPIHAEGQVDANGTTLDADHVDVRVAPAAPAS